MMNLKVLIFYLVMIMGIASAANGPKLQLDNYTLSSQIIEPGQDVTLTLYLKSLEPTDCAEKVSVALGAQYPVSAIGLDTQYLPYDLCTSSTVEDGKIKFKLHIDSQAQTGIYPITVLTGYEKNYAKYSESNIANIKVTGTPSFTASISSSTPTDVYAGDTASISIAMQNVGSGRTDNAKLSISAPAGIDVKWAGSENELGSIAPRTTASATFQIEASKTIKPGNYPITARLEYSSQDLGMQSQTFEFNLPIKPKAEFQITQATTDKLFKGVERDISLSVQNTGSKEARNLKVKLRPVYPFSSDGSIRFIESLKPGESKTLDFTINIDKDAATGPQILSSNFEFEDENGKKFTDTSDFAIKVSQMDIIDTIISLWWLFAIAIAIYAAIKMKIFKPKKSQS